MNIEIKDFIITSNPNEFTLKKRGIVQTGKNQGETVFETIGHYSSLASVLKAMPDRIIMNSDATDLGELIEEYKEIKKILKEALQE